MASARRRSLNSELPAYAPMLADYHRAFAPELQEIIGGLPIQPGDRVLDFASGDGSYAQWLAQRVGPEGVVLAVDRSAAFLRLARRTLRSGNGAVRQRIGLLRADIRRLPLADDTLDLVWCAQSLYSLPEPVDALRRMARLVRPGGHVAVFENDEFHHVLFPWPVEIELALKKAELLAFVATSDRPRKFYVGRELSRVFRLAGLTKWRVQAVAFTRQEPLDRSAQSFFTRYLQDLRERVSRHLEPSLRALFGRLTEPRSSQFVLSSSDLAITCVNHVVTGIKPAHTRGRPRSQS